MPSVLTRERQSLGLFDEHVRRNVRKTDVFEVYLEMNAWKFSIKFHWIFWNFKTFWKCSRKCSQKKMFMKIYITRYAHENGCPWDDRTCTKAAQTGSLDCLTYARENGCSWDAFTCAYAAHGGHLSCLTYARENGCPWDADVCSTAIVRGLSYVYKLKSMSMK